MEDYLTKQFKSLDSPNKFKVIMGHGGKPWVSDFNHPHYLAGRKAMKTGMIMKFSIMPICYGVYLYWYYNIESRYTTSGSIKNRMRHYSIYKHSYQSTIYHVYYVLQGTLTLTTL